MKKTLITGGRGFIGGRMASLLLARDHHVTLLDNHHKGFEFDSFGRFNQMNSELITSLSGSVLDQKLLLELVDGCDLVIHAAGIAGIDTVAKKPVETLNVNMLGTSNLLQACVGKKLERVITFSTSEVFGQTSFKTKETDSPIPGSVGEARWTYGVGKLAGEHLAYAYYKQYNVPTVIVRPFNVYGPGQTGEGAMQVFIRKALLNEPIKIFGDGSQIRAWCYITDFTDALMSCIQNPNAIGESYNIGNPRAVITTLGLAQTVCRVLNSKSEIIFADELSADVELRVPTVKKAAEQLNFRPKIDLEEGIKQTAEWIRSVNSSLPPLSKIFT
jgi:UDP-glucose 4-epimerase